MSSTPDRQSAIFAFAAFCDKTQACGCAGYFLSLLGRRVLSYGRTTETHVEHFPQQAKVVTPQP